jgi:hypothetical protein
MSEGDNDEDPAGLQQEEDEDDGETAAHSEEDKADAKKKKKVTETAMIALCDVPAGTTIGVPLTDDKFKPDDILRCEARENVKFQDIAKYRQVDESLIHVNQLRWDRDGRYGQIRKIRNNLVQVYLQRLRQKLPH